MEQEIELTAEDLWNDVSSRLREALNDTTYSTWFGEVDGEERAPGRGEAGGQELGGEDHSGEDHSGQGLDREGRAEDAAR